jgi:hypothetical protein
MHRLTCIAVDEDMARKSPKQRTANVKHDYVTLSVPRELYEHVEKAIQGTGFRSVTEYAIFLMREALLMKPGKDVRERLRALGYVE